MAHTKEVLYLECVLTAPELSQSGRDLAERTHAIDNLEAQLASVRKDINAQIAKAAAERRMFADAVSSGKVYREIECRIDLDFKDDVKRWIRTDTGEIAKESRIPAAERQKELELEKGGGNDGKSNNRPRHKTGRKGSPRAQNPRRT